MGLICFWLHNMIVQNVSVYFFRKLHNEKIQLLYCLFLNNTTGVNVPLHIILFRKVPNRLGMGTVPSPSPLMSSPTVEPLSTLPGKRSTLGHRHSWSANEFCVEHTKFVSSSMRSFFIFWRLICIFKETLFFLLLPLHLWNGIAKMLVVMCGQELVFRMIMVDNSWYLYEAPHQTLSKVPGHVNSQNPHNNPKR